MIEASGIGRHLRQMLVELGAMGVDDCALIGDPKKLERYIRPSWNIIPYSEGIYSPAQHLNYPLKNRAAKVAYFPHIHVPLFSSVGSKTVVTINDLFHLSPASTLSWPERAYMWLHYNRAVGLADLILPISEFTWSEVVRHFPGASGKSHEIIYPCLEVLEDEGSTMSEPMRRILEITEGQHRILFVGNVKPHKNLKRLVQAFDMTELNGCALIIVGKREGFLNGMSVSEQRLLESNRVIFTGLVSDQELGAWYRSCALLVLPSLYEGFGYPPLESLSQGTPAIVSDLPVTREACVDAVSYFDPLSVSSIAKCIRQAIDDEGYRSRTLARAADILKRYRPENTARRQALAIASLI